MDIKPIKNEADYLDALSLIDDLMDAKQGTVEGDKLDILLTLVDAYEAKHHAIAAPDPIAAIYFVMEQKALNRKDLEQYIGSRARVSEVLNHKRSLTLPMICRLHAGLGIPADVLIKSSYIART